MKKSTKQAVLGLILFVTLIVTILFVSKQQEIKDYFQYKDKIKSAPVIDYSFTLLANIGYIYDLSKWQGEWDCTQYPGDIVILRLGVTYDDGSYNLDNRFLENLACAKREGILVFAYYFVNPTRSNPTNEGTYAADRWLEADLDTPLIIDMEDNGGKSKYDTAWHYIQVLEEVKRRTGKISPIYTACWFANSYIDLSFYGWSIHPLWIAHYGSTPDFNPCIPEPWEEYWLHQWTSQWPGEDVGASSTYVDSNVTPLTWEELLDLFGLSGKIILEFDAGNYFFFSTVPFTITYIGEDPEYGELKVIYLPITQR